MVFNKGKAGWLFRQGRRFAGEPDRRRGERPHPRETPKLSSFSPESARRMSWKDRFIFRFAAAALALALALGGAGCAWTFAPGWRAEKGSRLPEALPEEVGVSPVAIRRMERAVESALRAGAAPGAVLLVVKEGRVIERRAFGRLRPGGAEPMTPEAIFDLASLTKVVATATATALLAEDGRLRLDSPAAAALPGFAAEGKGDVTLEDLLTHRSGLKAYEDWREVERRRSADTPPAEALLAHISGLPKVYPTGRFHLYSCLNYLTLARINELAAGESQEALLRRRVWEPLGMRDTGYRLSAAQKARLAPTGAESPAGLVHDPLARYASGSGGGEGGNHSPGNAGLFSSADDLAVFAQALLDGGQWRGKRVLRPGTVEAMFTPRAALPVFDPKTGGASGEMETRAAGWIVYRKAPYAHPAAPEGSFSGHTGYTGAFLWMDRSSRSIVVFLTNAVCAKEPPEIDPWRGELLRPYLEAIYGRFPQEGAGQ